jgi:hypothetical protein
MKFPRWAVTVTALVSGSLLTGLQAPTASATTFTATLVARNSDKCVSVSGASTQNGATSVQWDCMDAPNQQWRLVQKDSGYFSIEARNSGKCLSVSGASTQNGATLVQWDCVEGSNQHLRLG